MTDWSMKKDRQLIQLARSNLTVDQIAKRLDAAQASIVKIAKRLGISLTPRKLGQEGKEMIDAPPRPRSLEEDDMLRNLARAGEGAASIGRKLNRNQSNVRRRAKKLNILLAKSSPRLPGQ
jgi:transcriptional regulator with GAF, ATPase, and Fis domain